MTAGAGERTITIERRSYSVAPWRLIDSLTGCEVTAPVQFEHPYLGWMVIQSAGHDTKTAAVAALGRIAASALPRDRLMGGWVTVRQLDPSVAVHLALVVAVAAECAREGDVSKALRLKHAHDEIRHLLTESYPD